MQLKEMVPGVLVKCKEHTLSVSGENVMRCHALSWEPSHDTRQHLFNWEGQRRFQQSSAQSRKHCCNRSFTHCNKQNSKRIGGGGEGGYEIEMERGRRNRGEVEEEKEEEA